MKELYITPSGSIMFDPENRQADVATSAREAVLRVYRVEEDCIVKSRIGTYSSEERACAGDIVIVFYDQDYPNRVIVVKSDKWNENLDTYEKKLQEQKERWAATKQAESINKNNDDEKGN